jgi:putative ABC transport system substrate-binding protein
VLKFNFLCANFEPRRIADETARIYCRPWRRVAADGASAARERVRRIGMLWPNAEGDPEANAWLATFREELEKLGWVEGRNVRIDHRWAALDEESVRRFARKLVALQPGIILTQSTPNTVAHAHHSHRSYAGYRSGSTQPTAPYFEYYLSPFKAAAASFRVEPVAAAFRSALELESVFAAQAREPNGDLIAMPDSFQAVHRAEITSLAARHRLPVIYALRFFAEAGGLLSYGNDRFDNYRRSDVDRMLRGADPGEFPVQIPTKFELVHQPQDGQGTWP